jgi:hypothetical protein
VTKRLTWCAACRAIALAFVFLDMAIPICGRVDLWQGEYRAF